MRGSPPSQQTPGKIHRQAGDVLLPNFSLLWEAAAHPSPSAPPSSPHPSLPIAARRASPLALFTSPEYSDGKPWSLTGRYASPSYHGCRRSVGEPGPSGRLAGDAWQRYHLPLRTLNDRKGGVVFREGWRGVRLPNLTVKDKLSRGVTLPPCGQNSNAQNGSLGCGAT
ncbi:hypothetical protein E2C01_038236 [Portunus trituberculatus]|uniref:Uncharacterized protein n=1 Tax=Portunus trituberculatus TaxID=210409 RepID=A0A5B7FAB7_PORTR|nr:hypothetical protein [Portunus trituberculatus]